MVITWRERALKALHELADSGEPFTSDDLVERVGPPDADHEPNSRNSAIGAMFRNASCEGWIVSDGRVVRSRSPYRRHGAQRVWTGAR
jgi:hypothetical protein